MQLMAHRTEGVMNSAAVRVSEKPSQKRHLKLVVKEYIKICQMDINSIEIQKKGMDSQPV